MQMEDRTVRSTCKPVSIEIATITIMATGSAADGVSTVMTP